MYCTKNGWLQTNSFHDNWIESSKNVEIYITNFLELIGKDDYQYILVTDEPLLKHLNEKDLDIETYIKVMPLIKVENKKMISSKIGFSEFCFENDITTPRYGTYKNFSDISNILKNLKFPLINKNEFSWGGTDMSIINSENELLDLTKNISNNQVIQFQEFIQGEEIRIDAFYYKGELKVYFCAKVLNYANNRFTYNTRRLYYNNPEIKNHLIELGKKSGANGFANINYIKEDKTGIYYLIEMDLRTNSWLAYSEYLSKNNFITALKNGFNSSQVYKPDADLLKKDIEIGLFYKDLKRIYWQKDIKGLLRWIFNIKGYWKFLPFYDFKLSKPILKNLLNEFLFHRIKTAFKKN